MLMTEREGSGRDGPSLPEADWLRIDALSRHQISTRLGAHFDHLITRLFNDLYCLNFQRDLVSNVNNYRISSLTQLDGTSLRKSSASAYPMFHVSSFFLP